MNKNLNCYFTFEWLSEQNIPLYYDFYERIIKESGTDGVPIFTPTTIETMRSRADREQRLKDGINKKLSEPGWRRELIVFAPPVLNQERKIIGQVGLFTQDLQAARHRATLGIGIEKEFCGQGLGKTLMQKIIDWARIEETKLSWIDLGVFSKNVRAHNLYKSFGFKEMGYISDKFRHPQTAEPIDDIEMCLKL